MRRKKCGYCLRIFFMLAHAYCEGFDTTQREPGIKGRRHTASSILIELDRLIHFLIVQNDCAPDNITMPIDVLRGAMYHNVRAQLQWLLKVGAGKRIIDDN